MSKYSTDHLNNCSAPVIQTQIAFIDAAILSMQRKDQESDSRVHLIKQFNIIDTYMAELSTILLTLSQQLHRDQFMTIAERKCR